MPEDAQTSFGDVGLVNVVVDGLEKSPDSEDQDESRDEETYTEQISLPKNASLSALWSKLKGWVTIAISIPITPLCRE